MTRYQQLKKSYFEQHPHGRLQFRGYHDIFNPDYSERRSPFVYKLTSQPVNPDESWRDSPDDVWEFDEEITTAIWKEDQERYGGKCHTSKCETEVALGVPYCDCCIAAHLLTSSLSLKMDFAKKVPADIIEMAERSPAYQRFKRDNPELLL